jgi:type 1 glutamine amidotransferase
MELSKLFFAILISITPLDHLRAELPATSTKPMGQSFSKPPITNTLRVLLVGSGSSHHFPRDFLGTDAQTLKTAGGIDVAATPNLQEALKLIKEADVVVFSGNHKQWGAEAWQKSLHHHADNGMGLVILHAATWKHPWKGYNDRFVGGGTPSHGRGVFEVTVSDTGHAITKEVRKSFKITDENYRIKLKSAEYVHVCCHNAADKTKAPIPSVWVVKDPKTRIVCITLGHDDKAHQNASFKKLLINAVNWVGNKQR